MKSWSYFIWIKRLAPFALIALLWFGYTQYSRWHAARARESEMRMAEVTARLWIASAVYRDSSPEYITYRDSLLNEYHVTRKQADNYTRRYEDHPEMYYDFATRVTELVDSLYTIEDSIAKAKHAAQDTTATKPGSSQRASSK